MKNLKKIVALLLCAVLLVAGSVAGTLAYLLAQSEPVNNTFTVGNVEIKLDEAKTNEYGVAVVPEERVVENDYKLIPGHTYTKDPTVHILEGSEESYVRMIVKVQNYSNLKAAMPADKYPEYYNGDDFLLQYLVGGWDASTWVSTNVIAVADDVATYEFRYKESVAGPVKDADDTTVSELALPALFQTITVPGTVNNTELANLQNVTIFVEANAIQADGFANADAAWAAFN